MVFCLPLDVAAHIVHVRLADGKRTVTTLPMELGQVRVLALQPIRGTFFDLAHNIGRGIRASQQKQEMRVVGLRIDLNRYAADLIQNSAHVGM